MRLLRLLYAACLGLLPLAMTPAAQLAPPPPHATATPPAPAPAPDPDAARHAKRTACLKEARNKKLLATDRDAYVKNCVGKS